MADFREDSKKKKSATSSKATFSASSACEPEGLLNAVAWAELDVFCWAIPCWFKCFLSIFHGRGRGVWQASFAGEQPPVRVHCRELSPEVVGSGHDSQSERDRQADQRNEAEADR